MVEAEALRRSDELKTALLRSVSHDLRTPLTSIIAAGAALDSPSVTAEERHELSEAVVEQGQRLSRLVENLLDVSRLESGQCRAAPRAGRPRQGCWRRPGTRSGPEARSCGWRSTATCRRSAPTRPSSSAPSPTCSRTPSSTARGSRSWFARAWSDRASSSAWSTRAPASPRASGSGSSSRSTAPVAEGSGTGSGLGLAIAEGLHRGQRRRDRGRVAARPGQQLRRQLRGSSGGLGHAGVERRRRERRPASSSATTSRRSCAR